MLERLLIQNFQRHAKRAIDFGAITTIVGPTDAGKSAILRALRWVCTNTPGGGAFIRHGSPGCTVRLEVDGHVIVRRRGTTGDPNTYGLDGAEYKAFGRGVPDDIAALLNLSDLNWQGQHDAPFWFADTAGEVSRQLNAIVDLGIIDNRLAHVAREATRAKARLEAAEAHLTATKAEADRWAWVPRFEEGLAAVQEAAAQATTRRARAAALAGLVAGVLSYRQTADRAATAAKAGEAAATAAEHARTMARRRNALAELIAQAHRARADAAVPAPDFGPVAAAVRKARETRTRARGLAALVRELTQHQKERDEWQQKLEAAEAALPRKCPTCGAVSLSPSSAQTST